MNKIEYYLVPFMDDETATIYHPRNKKEIIPSFSFQKTEVNNEQICQILKECKLNPDVYHSREEKLIALMEDGGLYFNKAAVVNIKHFKILNILQKACFKMFGDDSSTYAACNTFNAMLKELATNIIDFKMPDYE
jgi:hypothetical protein